MSENSKVDLHSQVVPGVTWKTVRDIFKKICYRGFTDLEFAAYLFKDEPIKDLMLLQNLDTARPQFFAKSVFSNSAPLENFFVLEQFKKARLIFDKLIDVGFIENKNPVNLYEISRKGHSLRMQKCLPRIEKHRAISYIERIILRADEYNNSEGAYYINAIWAFGSLLENVKDIGDLDLSIDVTIKKHELAEKGPSQSKDPSINEAYKAVRVSPYVSLVSSLWLSENLRENQIKVNLIWKRINFLPKNNEGWLKILLDLPALEIKGTRFQEAKNSKDKRILV